MIVSQLKLSRVLILLVALVALLAGFTVTASGWPS